MKTINLAIKLKFLTALICNTKNRIFIIFSFIHLQEFRNFKRNSIIF